MKVGSLKSQERKNLVAGLDTVVTICLLGSAFYLLGLAVFFQRVVEEGMWVKHYDWLVPSEILLLVFFSIMLIFQAGRLLFQMLEEVGK